MDVDAGMDVVKQVPADVVGVFIDNEIIGTIPAPISADGPVPGSDFKAEAAGEPETMMVDIEAFDTITERGAKVLEAPMLEGMVHVEALIVRAIMAVPMVVVDVGSAVDATIYVMFGFGLGVGIVPLGRSRGDVPLIGARRVLPTLFRVLAAFFRVLGKSGKAYENCDGNWKQEASIHSLLLEHEKSKSSGPDEEGRQDWSPALPYRHTQER
jgi:hypothetical protein